MSVNNQWFIASRTFTQEVRRRAVVKSVKSVHRSSWKCVQCAGITLPADTMALTLVKAASSFLNGASKNACTTLAEWRLTALSTSASAIVASIVGWRSASQSGWKGKVSRNSDVAVLKCLNWLQQHVYSFRLTMRLHEQICKMDCQTYIRFVFPFAFVWNWHFANLQTGAGSKASKCFEFRLLPV